MELFKSLTTLLDNEGDRECAINTLESVLNAMTYFDKICIDDKNCILFNKSYNPEEAIYFSNDYIYIPEKLVVEVFSNDSYLEPYDIINVLENARYYKRRILCKDFYNVLNVRRKDKEHKLDCLTLDFNTLKEILADMIMV